MAYFHREGSSYITIGLILSIGTFLGFTFFPSLWVILAFFGSFIFLVFSLQFFRLPKRQTPAVAYFHLTSPADGKLVANEIIEDGRRQISIFMSPTNVHANWIPIAGEIVRSQYVPGKYLVAWHPKSSTENERHELDIRIHNNLIITVKQIAGAVARRVICYVNEGQQVERGEELGFIKFGSRVDILLPPDAEVIVPLEERVTGNKTVLAHLPKKSS